MISKPLHLSFKALKLTICEWYFKSFDLSCAVQECTITFVFCFILILFTFYHCSRLWMHSVNMPPKHMKLKLNWKGIRMQWHGVFLHKRPDRTEQLNATKTKTHIFTRPPGCRCMRLRQQLFLWGYDLMLGSKHQQPVAHDLPHLIMWNYQQNKYIREPEHQCLWR